MFNYSCSDTLFKSYQTCGRIR
uniref:Uncharacterized protein n=1 Tax=Rhizophora mucronata TaxID=61149 RepID=A0A2P2PSR2_RHIMU